MMLPKNHANLVCKNLKGLRQRLVERGMTGDTLSALDGLIERSESLEFRLLVIGAFNRGKSTLLNALVGETIFPSDLLPTTAVVTEIRHGDPRKIEVLDESGASMNLPHGLRDDDLAEILVSLTTQDGKYKADKHTKVRITDPSEYLPRGLLLVDTPGLESTIKEHDLITKKEIEKADGVLFVTVTDPPVGGPELDFFMAHIKGQHADKTLALLNKVDVLQGPEEVEKLVDHLAENTGLRDTHIVPISARNGLKALATKDDGLLSDSGMPKLREKIKRQLIAGGPYYEKTQILRRDYEAFREEAGSHVNLLWLAIGEVEDDTLDEAIKALEVEGDELRGRLGDHANATKRKLRGLCERSRDNRLKEIQDEFLVNIRAAKNMKALREVGEDFEKALGRRLWEDGEDIRELVEGFERNCEVELQHSARNLEKGLVARPLVSAMIGLITGGTSGAVATMVVSTMVTVTTTTSSILGSTLLGGVASFVGLGGLATTTTTLAPGAVAVLAGTVAVVAVPIGLLAAYGVAKYRVGEARKRMEEYVGKVIVATQRKYDSLLEALASEIDEHSRKQLLKLSRGISDLKKQRDMRTETLLLEEMERLEGLRELLRTATADCIFEPAGASD